MAGEDEIGVFLILIFFFFAITYSLLLKGPPCLNKDGLTQSQAFL